MATAAPAFASARPPSALLALAEFPRALFEAGMLPRASGALAEAPVGDGHPVLVLPGFIAGDGSTAALRRYLEMLGYDVHAWNLGRNFGPRSIGLEGERLVARIEDIRAGSGRTVSLVGWSLGGIMARVMARRMPDAIRQTITLGAPFNGSPKATWAWRAYELLSGQRIDDAQARNQLAEVVLPTRVPATAIYSRADGIVAWQNCFEPNGARTESIEVSGSHCGLVVNPAVLYAIADRLAQDEGDWQPFDRAGTHPFCYPTR